MRITKDQKLAILNQIKNLIENPKIYLFGSRTKDELKGGDIDLMVIVDEKKRKRYESLKIELLVAIKGEKSIGDRKIDLIITSDSEIKKEAFLQDIYKNAIQLE